MAGGTSGKVHGTIVAAIAKQQACINALQQIQQGGSAVGSPLHTISDAAVVAAIAALQAIQ